MLEREIKKRNLIIKGLKDEEDESNGDLKEKVAKLIKKLNVEMKMEEDVDEMRRMGKFDEGRDRPIVIKLMKIKTKMEILRSTKALRGSKIWIEEEYTKRTQNERKRLIPFLKQARQGGDKAILKFNKLIINNTAHKIEELEEIKGKEVRMKPARTISERSPESEQIGEQIRKINKISRSKN